MQSNTGLNLPFFGSQVETSGLLFFSLSGFWLPGSIRQLFRGPYFFPIFFLIFLIFFSYFLGPFWSPKIAKNQKTRKSQETSRKLEQIRKNRKNKEK